MMANGQVGWNMTANNLQLQYGHIAVCSWQYNAAVVADKLLQFRDDVNNDEDIIQTQVSIAMSGHRQSSIPSTK